MRRLLPLVVLAACGGAEKAPVVEEPAVDEPVVRPDEDEEEEVDDELEVTGTRGRFDPGDVEVALEPYGQALQDCFLSRVGKQKWLGGKVELRWEVGGDGTLKYAQIVSSDLGHWGVEKCLLDIARTVSFGVPKGKKDADVTIPLEFTGRRDAIWWEIDEVNAVLGKRIADLDRCEGAPAQVTVTLYLGARGKVQAAGFASPSPIDDAWAECAYGTVTKWTLRDPKGVVAKLAFEYPVP